jgi:hypothetical protein
MDNLYVPSEEMSSPRSPFSGMKGRNFTSVMKYSGQPELKNNEFHGITEPWQTVNNQEQSSKEFFLDSPEYNSLGIKKICTRIFEKNCIA